MQATRKSSSIFASSSLTATELLLEFILYDAGARLVYVEAATPHHPTLIHFCVDAPGNPPVCALPITEISKRSVRQALAQVGFIVKEGE